MYDHFGLVLLVNHACNMRCTYCYTGEKFNWPMSLATGRKAILRALASVTRGGVLELGFFGGEPVLCPCVGRRIEVTCRREDQPVAATEELQAPPG